LPEIYRSVGQPVLIPGDMGTNSYVMVGTDLLPGKESCPRKEFRRRTKR